MSLATTFHIGLNYVEASAKSAGTYRSTVARLIPHHDRYITSHYTDGVDEAFMSTCEKIWVDMKRSVDDEMN